jgi:hypothetical protein
MATTSAQFIPELWSAEVLDKFKQSIFEGMRPKRSKGAQMLRDAALGHPEYPEPKPELHRSYADNMTATEVRMRNEMYTHQLDAMAYSVNPKLVVPSQGDRSG